MELGCDRIPRIGISGVAGHGPTGGRKKFGGPLSGFLRFKDCGSECDLNGANSGFTPGATFQHALVCFEGMEAVVFERAMTDGNGILDLTVAGQFEFRESPCDRECVARVCG